MRKAEPKADRPVMPAGYQIAKSKARMMPWRWASREMARSRNYWVSTTRPDGRPHSMPLWGVWVDDAFYFSTDRGSRKARNLSANSALVVHLESGDDVVILEGNAKLVNDPKVLSRIDDAYFAKYKMRVLGIPGDVGIFGLRPRVAFAWTEKNFNKIATRWRFDAGRQKR